jgi:2',3'-cyclic-nucleotide 2'-phosphodiesterase (5'-nucleotidase family)
MVLLTIGGFACSSSSGNSEQDVIGRTTVDIDTRIRTTHVGEAAIGSFITDVWKSGIETKGKAMDVVLLNSGAIRGGTEVGNMGLPIGDIYPVGDLTQKNIEAWLPFGDSTDLVTLTGVGLKSVLERGVSSLPPDLKNDEGGWFLQVAGLKYTVTCANTAQQISGSGCTFEQGFDPCDISTPGERITKIEVGGTVVYDVDNAVDDLTGLTVRVCGSSFLTQAGDGHLAFGDATDRETIKQADFDLVKEVVNYIKANTPIAPATGDRITIIGDCGVPGTIP